jgi:signal transduction histidine kinase
MSQALGRHRLYWKIWLAILATVVLFAFLAVSAWRMLGERAAAPNVTGFAEVAGELLPPPGAPRDAQQAALDRWRQKLGADLGLFATDGALIVATHGDFDRVRLPDDERGHHVKMAHGPALALALPDGRTLLLRRPGRPPPPPGPALTFALLALAVGIGAYPVVRRLTRRLERLQAGVTEWGAGNLAARVEVHGRDEVAQLAAAFNEAASRIEQLVGAHRSLLANASHELRSPLTRIRLGIELLSDDPTPERRAGLVRDIGELDQLIDEILLASRLEGGVPLEHEQVDFRALVAAACERAGAALLSEPVTLHGSARLLQRLVRNLLDNALRHGGGRAEVQLRALADRCELDVLDRGPGIEDSERERVFEPFYRVRGTSEASGGVGLGLSLVRQIARQHGGEVRCLPRDGGGSIFRVTLPRTAS